MQILRAALFHHLLLLLSAVSASGFGSMGPISAALGYNGFFCAIDASGKQEVVCWGRNSSYASSSSSSSASPSSLTSISTSDLSGDIPAMAALSGGEEFLCGISANESGAFCWSSLGSGTTDLVPSVFQNTSYSRIAAGKNHVCAIRGSYYFQNASGIVDCWEIRSSGNRLSSKPSTLFHDEYISSLVFKRIVSGEGFSCGAGREGGLVCWGPNSASLGVANISENFVLLASGKSSVCGRSNLSAEIKCWGANDSFPAPPDGIRFVSLSAGAHHFCGIREDDHGVECWGNFNLSSVPKASGFMAIASSDFTTCAIREVDLVLDCWNTNGSLPAEYSPPLELCSPGLCSSSSCGDQEFAFNASVLNEPDLTSLCLRKDLKICSPCGSNCSEGFLLSSPCSENTDRVCAACSLCQNSSCLNVCGIHRSPNKHWHQLRRLLLIVGPCVLGFLLFLLGVCVLQCVICTRLRGGFKKQSKSGIGKSELETVTSLHSVSALSVAPCPEMAQIFRLSELKDATNGFKEFNELGRGSYGFVYKAVLADGHQVAVKRANAATIIHTNNRDFEMELEVLCSLRHSSIVNLLGYCSEMGERLLVYEYMPYGTLHDHLHGGLSPLNWSLRLKIAIQAAKGLEYLHKEVVPPVIHRHVKSSNILLDSERGARMADFGLLSTSQKELSGDVKDDVYNFGIVLLEILSGRKAYDREYSPPNIEEWALPLIKQGKAAATIDRTIHLLRNVEPLLKLADIAELALRESPVERPDMSELANLLQQTVKDGLTS